jgi:class 3 adenylate cyclase/tetratricopeptide (TPR) repeat protein
MAVCGSCGADNPAGFRFCGSCGSALGGPGCPSCGFINPVGQHFCGQCGTRLNDGGASAAPRPTSSPGERKLATILFADVVGFTSMSENADPEAVARTVDAAFRRMAEVVESHGGTVDKYLGDALMAVFGVPVAHDDDAERAVAAALAMRDLGGDLAFSIGINSGEVMATAVGRDGDVTVIGDAVNVAARLEKAASGGEVLVGPLTAELAAGGIAFRERQPVILKGKRNPVPVFEVLGLRGAGAAPAVEQPPLVGRDDDLAFLRSQWRRVVRDERSLVVLVTGEAGMGKTRLVEELSAEIADEAAVAHARYPAYGGMGGPQVAKDIAEQLGPMGENEIDVRVKSVAGEMDPSLRDLDPEAFRQEQLWAFRRYLESKATERPVLIVIDDIHRSGDETLELLGALMARLVEVPLMLALVGRPDDWLVRFQAATTVRLAPLSPADSGALVDALLPAGAEPGDLVTSLVGRGTGNPLYLRELVAVVCASGGGAASLPPTLQAILAARLDALPPDQKGAIQRVSVLGDVAMEDQVAVLGLSDPAPALRSLVAAGLLRQRQDECYEVADPLLREVAYETLPRQVRGEWHRRAAPAVDDPVQHSRQLERAAGYLPDDEGLQREAADALRDAGVGLLDGYRLNDGIALLQKAVAHGERDPSVLLRLGSNLANAGRGEEALDVLAQLDGQEITDDQQAERSHVETVTHMFRAPEDAVPGLRASAERWAAVGRKDKQGWALSNMGVALFNSGHMHEAAEALERSLVLFEESGEKQGKLAAQSFLALIRPEDPRVTDWLGDALRHTEKVGDRTGQVNARILLAWHHTFRSYLGGPADIATAYGYTERAGEMAAELQFAEFELHSMCLRARFCRLMGRIADAQKFCAAARHMEHPDDTGVALLTKGVGFMVDVAVDPATPMPEAVYSPDPVAWMGYLTAAEALVLAGRIDEALELLADEHMLPGMAALEGMSRGLLRGLCLVLTGRAAEARAFAESAMGSAVAVRARPAQQAATALIAEIEARTGDVDGAAREVLAEVGDTASDSVAGVLALRARAALGDQGAAAQAHTAAQKLAAPGLVLGMP